MVSMTSAPVDFRSFQRDHFYNYNLRSDTRNEFQVLDSEIPGFDFVIPYPNIPDENEIPMRPTSKRDNTRIHAGVQVRP